MTDSDTYKSMDQGATGMDAPTFCEAIYPPHGAWSVCTEPPGHEGDHIARNEDDSIEAQWARDDDIK